MERNTLCALADELVGSTTGPLRGSAAPVLATPAITLAVGTVGVVGGAVGIGMGVGANFVKGDEEEPAAPAPVPAEPGAAADTLVALLARR